MGLRRSEAVVEGGEEIGPLLGGDDVASSAISRIRTTLDQVFGFEIIEEVGHHGAVDPEMLGQGELAPHGALCGGREDLVAPRTAGEVGDRGVGCRDVGPKDRAQAPPEVISQCVVTSARAAGSISLTRDIVHIFIIRVKEARTAARQMLCINDDLSRI